MDALASQLELYSARNMFLSLSQYSACLTAGCLSDKSKWRENLMSLYARISLCRTVNRSLDYFACLSRIRKYGFGQHDVASPCLTRLLTLANSLCDLVYYPAECTAWLIEANVFGANRSSRPFRLVSLACWLSNIIVSIIGNTLKIIQLRRLLRAQRREEKPVAGSLTNPLLEIYKCILTLIGNLCFLLNCVHWLAIPGFLWSGKLSVFMVGLCGTVASLCNVVKMVI